MSLKTFADALPDYAKDLRLNLGSILSDQLIGEERKLSLLLACAHGSGYKPLVDAAEAEVAGKIDDKVANAARGAAAVMAMNNVYYRFVHLVANPEYGTKPARLRMNFIGQHGIAKEEFELFSLAVKHYPDFEDALVGLGRTLVSLGRPEQALPHLQKALALNASNEVLWYQLSLVYKSLGNAPEQQKALAEFQRLRGQKSAAAGGVNFSRQEVTKQKLDPAPRQQDR